MSILFVIINGLGLYLSLIYNPRLNYTPKYFFLFKGRIYVIPVAIDANFFKKVNILIVQRLSRMNKNL